jgi:hypothetical protein
VYDVPMLLIQKFKLSVHPLSISAPLEKKKSFETCHIIFW